jgi:predicted secreted protein
MQLAVAWFSRATLSYAVCASHVGCRRPPTRGWHRKRRQTYDKGMLQLDESADGRTLTIARGSRLLMRLAENPTTGFRWSLVHDGDAAIRIVSDQFEPDGGMLGQGGLRRWELETLGNGGVRLCFNLSRAWEAQAPARTIVVALAVSG